MSINPFLFLVIFLQGFELFAQNQPGPYSVKGTIIDSLAQTGVEYITISLKNAEKLPVKNVLTKIDGTFGFEKLSAGDYSITIVALGYITKTVTFRLESINPATSLGQININPSNDQLTEVVITADRPLISQDANGITYNLQADPESKINSVLEMMRKVPLLSLDADDNIKLKGNSNYKILLNGRPSGSIERNPKDILRSMPASAIQSIMVITNPSAKYDSEGLDGIINIITNKRTSNGYNGTLNLRENFPINNPASGGAFTTKNNRIGLTLNGGISSRNLPESETIINRITSGMDASSLDLNGFRKSKEHRGYILTEFSYEIDSLNLLSAQLNYNDGRFGFLMNGTSALTNQQSTLQGYNMIIDADGGGNGIDAAINYQLGFKKTVKKLLTLSYRYYTNKNSDVTGFSTANQVNYSGADYNQSNYSGISEQTFQIDYMHPVDKLIIEAGLKGIWRDNSSDFEFRNFNSLSREFEIDPLRTDQFNNLQNVFGAYNSYQYIMKSWDLRAGLRLEETIVEAAFVSGTLSVKQNYFNLIPSISAIKKFKDLSNISLGFTQRMLRPGIRYLNPFVERAIPKFESMGNPGLKPVLSNNVQLLYNSSQKVPFAAGLSYSFINNAILPVSVFDASTSVTRTTIENIGKDRRLGGNMNISYSLSTQWRINSNGTITYIETKGLVNGTPTQNEGITGNLFASTGYTSPNGWRITGNVGFISRNISLQGKTNALISSSLSVNKDFIKDKLTFSASVANPFTAYRTSVNNLSGHNFLQTTDTRTYFRSFNLSLDCRFGKLKQALRKNKRGIKNDDVL